MPNQPDNSRPLADAMFAALVRHVYSLPDNMLTTEARAGLPDVILAMPEMQAIRRTLFDTFHPVQWRTADGPTTLHRINLRASGLPDSVVEWVLACTSEPEEPK